MEDNKKYDVERLRSLRLEKQILGYLLKSEENIKDYYDVSVLLTEKVFADKYNKQIFNVIISLLKSGQTINTVSVAQRLSDLNISHKDGNDIDNYLDAVSFTQINKKGFIEACKKVYTFFLRREAYYKAKQIAKEQFQNAEQNPMEILSSMSRVVDEFKVNAVDDEKPTFILEGLTDHIKDRANNPQDFVGIPWPYEEVNDACGGLRDGDLHMIIASTGAGKTTLLMDVGLKVASAGYHVIYLNTEMTDDQMRDRLAGMITTIEPILISTGKLRNEAVEYNKFVDKEQEMLEMQKNVGKYLIHKTAENMSVAEIESYVKYVYNRYVGEGKPCLIIYDYLKIIDEQASGHNQEHQIIRNKSNSLKKIALDLNSPVLTALQTNRRPDDDTVALKEALKVDSTAMAMSHSASWFTSFLAFYKAKDVRERELDGDEYGTHKLVPLKIRSWGFRGLQYEQPLRRDTPDGIVYQKNHINLERGVFTLESRGTLRNIVNRFDIQNNSPESDTPATEQEELTL